MTTSVSTHASAISRVSVKLEERSYDIVIGDDLLSQAGFYVAPVLRSPRVAILTDENVAPLHLKKLEKSLEGAGIDLVSIILPAGESSKSLATYEKVMDQLLDAKIQRDEALIALGGGVIGDLTGFAASTLRRGVDFIQIPTTLLSQVDSSVGGKTGVNASQGKNLIGAFYQPKLVLADVGLLSSLPKRQLLAGYAEVVKYGLLGDFEFFNWLEVNGPAIIEGNIAARIKAVEQSVLAKAAIVAQDEREGGVRALLNLGHTFGHALEAETGYGPYLNHGEAVAIGMIMAAELSIKMKLLSGQDGKRIHAHFETVGLPLKVPEIAGLSWQSDRLLDHMRQDKKVSSGKLTFILMRSIGDAFTTQNVTVPDILDVLTSELNSGN